jgi:serine/threonine-protein kinase RsbW
MTREFSQTLTGGRGGLASFMDALEADLGAAGAPPGVVAAVMVALDEIVANALSHGADGREPAVEVKVRVGEGEVAVEVIDNGRAFDPTAAPTPDVAGGVGERAIGGLGLHLVRRLMDAVAYERRSEHNHLRISKRY